MVDTGTQYSVLNQTHGSLSGKTSVVQGATRTKVCSWKSSRKVDLGRHQITHSFLVVPESLAPLLGRDLLTKIGACIHFEPDRIEVIDSQGCPLHVLTMSLADEHRLLSKPPTAWDKDMNYWVKACPEAWAEIAGIELAAHQPMSQALSHAGRGSSRHCAPHSLVDEGWYSEALSLPVDYTISAGEEARQA